MSSYTFVRGFSPLHDGVDLAAARGTPVHATRGGTVRFAGWGGSVPNSTTLESGGGNVVEVNDTAGDMEQYAHLDTIAVAAGHSIAAGDLVGTVGETGNAFGYHLHYGMAALAGGARWFDPLQAYSLAELVSLVSGQAAAPASSTSQSGGAILDGFLATIGRSLSDPIRSGDVQPFVDYIKSNTTLLNADNPALDLLPGAVPGSSTFKALALKLAVQADVGKPWSVLGSTLEAQAGAAGDPFAGVSAAIAGVPAAIGGALQTTAWLVAFLGIIALGLYLTLAPGGSST